MKYLVVGAILIGIALYYSMQRRSVELQDRIIERFTDPPVPPLTNNPGGKAKEPAQSFTLSDHVREGNIVDSLAPNWQESMEEAKWQSSPRSCGTLLMLPARGGAKAGFYPNTKNCNINEQIVVENQHDSTYQSVECQITPNRKFSCNNLNMGGRCKFPPFLYGGKYHCNSADSAGGTKQPFSASIIVNSMETPEYNKPAIMSSGGIGGDTSAAVSANAGAGPIGPGGHAGVAAAAPAPATAT
jgi:hypothetical protein